MKGRFCLKKKRFDYVRMLEIILGESLSEISNLHLLLLIIHYIIYYSYHLCTYGILYTVLFLKLQITLLFTISLTPIYTTHFVEINFRLKMNILADRLNSSGRKFCFFFCDNLRKSIFTFRSPLVSLKSYIRF